MASESLAPLVQDLSSLDHALLLSLIAKQHCLIQTTSEILDDVVAEAQLIATQLFGLSSIILECHADTTLEDFSRGILIEGKQGDSPLYGSGSEVAPPLRRTSSYSVTKPQSRTDWSIASIVIAKNLNVCSQQVQIQALELIRTHRIFTHTSVYTTPKPFLFVTVSPINAEPLNAHLNDMIFLSHFHDPLDELPRLQSRRSTPSSPSVNSSVIRHSFNMREHAAKMVPLPTNKLLQLSTIPTSIAMTSEVRAYLVSITIFLRTHRALIPGSATPLATQHLDLLSRCLALLHGLDYVSPALVALAARKVYRHRLRILKPEDAAWERSIMYGSRVKEVQMLLEGMWADAEGNGEVADHILDDVIGRVEVPV